jgi:hypothetical protein
LLAKLLALKKRKLILSEMAKKRSLMIGRKIQGEIELIEGKEKDQPVLISNTKYWMGPDIIAAKGIRSKVRDYGRVWDFGGRSAEVCPIDWKGSA